jgi:hypothetical protein
MKSKYIFMSLLAIVCSSCSEDFVDVETPYTLVESKEVFKDPQTATAAQVGIYLTLANYTPYQMSRYTGSYVDELTSYDTYDFTKACYTNNLISTLNYSLWSTYYGLIYQSNLVVENLEGSTAIETAVKDQLLGEAKFTRAFFYFNLVNIFGDVPMPLTTNYKKNIVLARTSQELVYQQMVTDLKDAEKLLNENYVDGSSKNSTSERIRPNKWAAKALLARVFLYAKDYTNAEKYASEVIRNTSLYTLTTDLNTVFSKEESTEAIWQLDNQGTNSYVTQGYGFIPLFGVGPYGDSWSSSMSDDLVDSFENGDKRKEKWILKYDNFGTVYNIPYKYQQGYTSAPNQNETILRLSEQYLIRAEARTELSNPAGAKQDLDAVRQRANTLGVYSGALDKASLLTAILHERQVEFFAEWGHRFFDLKRMNKIDDVMSEVSPEKGGSWESYKKVWPIPMDEIKKDSNLSQNEGYN